LPLSSDKQERIVSAIEDFSETDMTSSEANTKKKIIEPLLDVLDWDTRSNEVRLEYPIKIGSGTSHVDYALLLEDKPVVLVEAKPFSSIMSQSQSRQVISYGKVEDVQWAVLTNGKYLKVFDTEQGKSQNECLVTEIDLRELPAKAEYVNLLSRESILAGEIEQAAARLAATRKAIDELKGRREEIAEKFKGDLLEITGSEVENRVAKISSQLADQAIQLFEKSTEPPRSQEVQEVKLVRREELADKQPGDVVVCTSRAGGIEFVKKYSAWGYVNMAREDIRYFALYVGAPKSSVLYFAEVESITPPLESKDELGRIKKEDAKSFQRGQRVIHLKLGTLTEFADPIPLENRKAAPRAIRYTTLDKLIEAEKVYDL
jgi:hypothetical protein